MGDGRHSFSVVYNSVSLHLRPDSTPQNLLVPFPRCLSEDFYTRCEMLNFQLILKLSRSILLTWCLKKQSPAPILASGTFAVEEGVGREELLPLVSVVSLPVPFLGGRRSTVSPSELVQFLWKTS